MFADYEISSLENDLTGILHSTTLAKVQNRYQLYRRAARTLLTKIDPAPTKRTSQITNSIHTDIHDYEIASDTKGNKIIDIRPQVNRDESDSFFQRFSKTFDQFQKSGTFNIRWESGTKTLRVIESVGSLVTLHQMDSIAGNGTWAVGDDATNLTKDTLEYMSGGASLNFDLDGSGTTGYIEISDMDDVDLTDYDEKGSLFVKMYSPAPTAITNVILRWGNDTTNYWSRTVTSPHDVSSFKTGWNILRFDWNGATESVAAGVDPAAIDYLRLTVTYDGTADTDLRVDRITCSTGEIYEQEYYSENLFRTSGGTWIAEPTATTDIINLDEDGYNLYLFECAILMAQQVKGIHATADISFWKKELYGDPNKSTEIGLYDKYNADHPSEAIRPQEMYYDTETYNEDPR